MQREAFPAVVIEGIGTCRRFSAGAKFTLADHYDANGDYYLTRVSHVATVTSSYLGGSNESFEYVNKFECVPATVTYRPPRVTPKPRIEGAANGDRGRSNRRRNFYGYVRARQSPVLLGLLQSERSEQFMLGARGFDLGRSAMGRD